MLTLGPATQLTCLLRAELEVDMMHDAIRRRQGRPIEAKTGGERGWRREQNLPQDDIPGDDTTIIPEIERGEN